MNQSNKSRFLLEWFCIGNFGIEATIIVSPDSIINNVTKCLPSAINKADALQHSPLNNFMQFYAILCISKSSTMIIKCNHYSRCSV